MHYFLLVRLSLPIFMPLSEPGYHRFVCDVAAFFLFAGVWSFFLFLFNDIFQRLAVLRTATATTIQ